MKKVDRSIEKALLGEHYSQFVELREQYLKALNNVREHLKENPLVPIYENHINGKIGINDKGDMLVIKEVLPSLTELREQADKYGIDISDLGRSRSKIVERIEKGADQESKNTTPKSQQKEQTIQKAQSIESNPQQYKSIEKQPKDQEESGGEFDFLDEFIDEDIEEDVPTQTDEEKALLSQMLALGNRGGKLDQLASKVDLDKVLADSGK